MKCFRLNLSKALITSILFHPVSFSSLTYPRVYKIIERARMGKNKWAFYAVAKGRNVGLFSTWNECKIQIDGYKGARFKGFNSKEDAER